MAEAIMALAREIIAQQPSVVMMVWEIPPDKGGWSSIFCKSLPDSIAVRHGLVDKLFDEFNPPVSSE
jgi:hypothetical protein